MAMRKGRFFLFLLLFLFVGLFLVGQLARRVPAKTVLVLTIDRAVEEEDWPSFDARFWEGEVVVFRHILEALDRARHDERIAGVSVEIKWVEMSFGKIQELRQKLQEFTAGGKFCTVYLEEATNRSYYLASACPEIYLLPKSGVALTGLMGHTTFLRGSLEKLHVSPDFYRIGEYKNAPDVYTEKKYTAPHREVVTSLLTEWQKQIVEGIAAGRKLDQARVEQLVREGPYLSQEAVEKGLVDKLFYHDQYRDLLKKKAGSGELHTLAWDSYRTRTGPATGPKIAIVYATGTITPGTSSYHPMAGRLLGADTVAGALRAAREDGSVKAIVLRVDSPGGVAFASEIIRREVILAKQKKPVVVSMSDVAASGGYWIAMSANKIVADPGTVTGSIGIYAGKMNIKGFYELLGMTKDYVALAPNATFLYAFENFTPEQREILLRYLRDGYNDFLQGVSEGRGIPVEEVDRIGRGRVWLGHQAKDLKLVDELGGLEQAVALAKKMAGIPFEDSVSFQVYPREKTTWEKLEEWLDIRAAAFPPPNTWFDPGRLPLNRESVLVLLPFRIEPR